jgi:hypothetical protein
MFLQFCKTEQTVVSGYCGDCAAQVFDEPGGLRRGLLASKAQPCDLTTQMPLSYQHAVPAVFLNDVLRFNPDTGAWASAVAASAAPPPRYRAGFVGVGSMLYLFGGVGNAGEC